MIRWFAPVATATIALTLAVALLAACRREPPGPASSPPDAVDGFPAAGSFVLLPWADFEGSSPDNLGGPTFIDMDTGAAHRLTVLDASCDPVVSYDDARGRHLHEIRNVAAWSPARQTFYVGNNGGTDVPLFALGLDGRCTPMWHDGEDHTMPVSVSADGTAVLPHRWGPLEVRKIDGSGARNLGWPAKTPPTPEKHFDDIEIAQLAPHADRVALVRVKSHQDLFLPAYAVQVCDLAGACQQVFSIEQGKTRSLVWSPDGKRLAFTYWHDLQHFEYLALIDVEHPERPAAIVHPEHAAARGQLHASGWSPDGTRLALVSSHEGGCTPEVRDSMSECRIGVYVVGADGQGMRLVRRGIRHASTDIWWFR